MSNRTMVGEGHEIEPSPLTKRNRGLYIISHLSTGIFTVGGVIVKVASQPGWGGLSILGSRFSESDALASASHEESGQKCQEEQSEQPCCVGPGSCLVDCHGEVNGNYRAERNCFVWSVYLSDLNKKSAFGSDSSISSVSVRNVGSGCNDRRVPILVDRSASHVRRT